MTQNRNGNAFEYACVIAAEQVFQKYQRCHIITDAHLNQTKNDYDALLPEQREILLRGAIHGMQTISLYEANLVSASDEPLIIRLNNSKSGQAGDVRDLLFQKPNQQWQVGISSKHNHDAIKHSRLSRTIDFGKKWMAISTPEEYFSNLATTWTSLDSMKRSGMLWSEVPGKEEIYEKVLVEFCSALEKIAADRTRYDVAQNFLEYLIGRHDFYKLMVNVDESNTSVQVFNLHNTLHRHDLNGISAKRTSQFPVPREFIRIRLASYNRVEVLLDKNWSVGMRIHSASSRVENSLKFDIRLDGIPASLHNILTPWT